ncbi:MAG: hypothetical protein AB8B56_00420 [Crocinitomicaceae bacterium]
MQKLKTYSKNVFTAFLALIFFANITFAHSVDFHLCQGEFQSVAFFGKKASCGKMMEAQMSAPMSCCDVKNESKGLVIREKSCCDNITVLQDNVLVKPSIDFDNFNIDIDLFSDFKKVQFKLLQTNHTAEKVEIPPPPNIHFQHTQEKLQVFII